MDQSVVTPPAGSPRRFSTSAARSPEAGALSLSDGRRIRSTTVICVRRGTSVVMAADGQVTLGDSVIKHTAKKIRRLYQDKVLAGFAGSTRMLSHSSAASRGSWSNMPATWAARRWSWPRSGVPTRCCGQLEALLMVADPQQTLPVSGTGDVIEPDEGIAAIGSGGSFALAAARALMENTELSAREIAEEACGSPARSASIRTTRSRSKS